MTDPSTHHLQVLARQRTPLLVLGAAALLLAACQSETHATEKRPVAVRTVVAESVQRVESASITGEIAAATTSDLAFRVAGRVGAWHADVGSQVKAGQLLAELESAEQIADLDAAKAALAAAETRLKIARTAFERQRALLSNGYTTRNDHDQAQETLRLAEGTLTSARAQLVIAQEALAYTLLLAPADGIVTARAIETGQVVQTTHTAFTLAESGQRDAIFDLNEARLAGIRVGSRLTISLISDPTIRAVGTVREIAPSIDAQSATIRVKVAVDDAPAEMDLGSPVSGTIAQQSMAAIVLPWTALTALDGEPAVWVLDPVSQTVQRKAVQIGRHESKRFTVLSGLEAGEEVVADGTKFLSPGQKITLAQDQHQDSGL